MISGIGTDIVEIDRIASVYTRFGQRFVNRLLTNREKNEMDKRSSTKAKINYLAKQFAAKEAVSKALGTGIGSIGFTDIEIIRNQKGKPEVELTKQKSMYFDQPKLFISLTDSQSIVLAFCVAERT